MKIIIDWETEDQKIDEFSVVYSIGRAVFTLLTRSDHYSVKHYARVKTDVDLFFCDPEKNLNCKKTECQHDCFFTTNRDFAKDNILPCSYDGHKFNAYMENEVKNDD